MSGMFEETELLAADLAAAGVRVVAAASAVLAKGALNIKNDWRASASGLKHAPLYPLSISYDIETKGTTITAEVGPDKHKPQGALGNLIEFGSSKNPPHLDGARALAAEEPRFLAELADAVGSAVLP